MNNLKQEKQSFMNALNVLDYDEGIVIGSYVGKLEQQNKRLHEMLKDERDTNIDTEEYIEEKYKAKLLDMRRETKRYREALGEVSNTELPGIPIEKHINLLRKIAEKALEESDAT